MPVTFPARRLYLDRADEELKSPDNQAYYLEFDGYSGNGVESWDLELTEVGAEMALIAVADLLSDARCWQPGRHTANATGA